MNELSHNIDALIKQLQGTALVQNSVEAKAFGFLSELRKAIGQGEKVTVDQCIARLNRFWLNSVPWCSNLSKDIEKILIQYEEKGDVVE